MNKQSASNRQAKAKIRGTMITVAFALCLIIGTGPGTLLANSPEELWGWPQLYLWGLFWCVALILLVIAAAKFVWRKTSDDQDPSPE